MSLPTTSWQEEREEDQGGDFGHKSPFLTSVGLAIAVPNPSEQGRKDLATKETKRRSIWLDINKRKWAGTVAHACNPNTLGGQGKWITSLPGQVSFEHQHQQGEYVMFKDFCLQESPQSAFWKILPYPIRPLKAVHTLTAATEETPPLKPVHTLTAAIEETPPLKPVHTLTAAIEETPPLKPVHTLTVATEETPPLKPVHTLTVATEETPPLKPVHTLTAAIEETPPLKPVHTLTAAIEETPPLKPVHTLTAAIEETPPLKPVHTLTAAIEETPPLKPVHTLTAAIEKVLPVPLLPSV
ncbi:hypothetical protein AAY473_006654, partial [Plecturocebus cupreus]